MASTLLVTQQTAFLDISVNDQELLSILALEKEMATHSSILCLKNPMDRGARQATVHGVAKSQI